MKNKKRQSSFPTLVAAAPVAASEATPALAIPEKKESKPETFVNKLGKWTNRAIAGSIWVGFLGQIFGWLQVSQWMPPLLMHLPWRGIVMTSLIVYVVRFGPLKFAGMSMYVLCFPVVALFIFLSAAWGVLKIQWRMARLVFALPGKVRQSRTLILWLTAAPLVTVLLVSLVDDATLLSAMAVVLVVQACLVTTWVSFWVVSPITVLSQIAEKIMRWLMSFLGGLVCDEIPTTGELDEAKKKSLFETRPGLDEVSGWAMWIESQLLTPRMAVSVFLALFLALFAVTVASFGGAYWAEWKANSASFVGSGQPPSFGEAAFFSLSTITTAGVSDLRANTARAKGLVTSELLFAVALFTLLALSFSTLHATDLEQAKTQWAAARGQVDADVGRYKNLLRAVEKIVEDRSLTSLQGVYADLKDDNKIARWERAVRMIRPSYLP